MIDKTTGYFYLPQSNQKYIATLSRQEDGFVISTAETTYSDLQVKHVDPFMKGVERRIYFSNGCVFVPNDRQDEIWQRLQSRHERVAGYLERPTFLKAGVFLGGIIVAIIFIRLFISGVSGVVAAIIPSDIEAQIGITAYEQYREIILSDSLVPLKRQQKIIAQSRLLAQANDLPDVDIYFHNTDILGPNAFVLPGGPIVVTDSLLEIASDEEILGIIGHEYGHLVARHGLKRIVEGVGLFTVSLILFGGTDSLLEEVAASAITLSMLQSSRQDETEADELGARYLAGGNFNPHYLSMGFVRLYNFFCADHEACALAEESDLSFLQTHPAIIERIPHLTDYVNTLSLSHP